MVLISITLACVFLSPVTRVIFFAAAGILCAYELSRNLEKLEVGCAAGVMYAYLAAQAVLTLIDRFTGVEIGLFWYMVLFACAVYFALFSGILRKDVAGKGALGTVFGLAYPCFQFSMIMVICVSDIWLQTLAVACLSTWVCDSFALFGGKRFGKHKIAPLQTNAPACQGKRGYFISIRYSLIICPCSSERRPLRRSPPASSRCLRPSGSERP